MQTLYFSVTPFTSLLISSLRSNLFPVSLHPMAYLRVTAPFTMEPTLREPNVSIVYGHGARLAGCAESTRKCIYHASQKQWPCSSLIGKDIFASSKREASPVLMLPRSRQ